jgi:hypothetical protein
VFVERWILKDLVPYWQLVYCRSIDDLADWAGSLGSFLLREGVMFCVADSNGAVPGVIGWYRSDGAAQDISRARLRRRCAICRSPNR